MWWINSVTLHPLLMLLKKSNLLYKVILRQMKSKYSCDLRGKLTKWTKITNYIIITMNVFSRVTSVQQRKLSSQRDSNP